MCRFIVCIVYIHRYTSFLTEAALTKAISTKAAFGQVLALKETGNSITYDTCESGQILASKQPGILSAHS